MDDVMYPSYPSHGTMEGARATCASFRRLCVLVLAVFGMPSAAAAAQSDIAGPPGSAAFGASVVVLPNGNFVVTDPNGPLSASGAVYLFSADGVLISTLTGNTANDQVGSVGIAVVGGGNFVVMSPYWHNAVGAATWVDGNTGLNGTVSSANSLVGSIAGDLVGNSVTALSNGNYVVASPNWNNGVSNAAYGAVTWGSGTAGVKGVVSAANSLVGATAADNIAGFGGVVALSNGNYVVGSPNWHNGGTVVGAATWGDGTTGTVGTVSAGNSLIGSTSGDNVGTSITALRNGNYVVASPDWQFNGAAVGAATWVDGAGPFSGVVSDSALSGSISLIGVDEDHVASGGIVALSNGNYVVVSPQWSFNLGAVTWGDGVSGTLGFVNANHSLTGSTYGDAVGQGGVTALSNGNYVVGTPGWQSAGVAVGASTWVNGNAPCSAVVTTANSLFGTTANDGNGMRSYALADGNYAVTWPQWNNGQMNALFGAVVWGDGAAGTTGPVLPGKALYGSTNMDQVGVNGMLALKNGNAVVVSGSFIDSSALLTVGAWTWTRAGGLTTGAVGSANSVTGFPATGGGAGRIGSDNAQVFADGYYAIASPHYAKTVGAVTLGNGAFRTKSMIHSWNSVIGGVPNGGASMTYSYDATRHRLIVGRPYENIVSLFTSDQVFADDFDP